MTVLAGELGDLRREESCGCVFMVASGELVRGCRRHDVRVAGRIVEALEDAIRFLWFQHRTWISVHDASPWQECESCRARHHELRALLRIRRAGRS